ncbi:hypothetical protein K439DRAFT_1637347 [Ramaria rubella]|nr:hypothetical protein K439DRAFT_1637347 [Ramaria rubella]
MEEKESQKKDEKSDGLVKNEEEEMPVNGSSSKDLLSELLPLEGTVPSTYTPRVFVSDNEKGYTYCLFSVKSKSISQLFRLNMRDMRWEELSLRHYPSDIFQEPQSALPYRESPGVALFGPKEHHRLLLIGGRDHEGHIQTDDFWCLDVEKLVWSKFQIEGGSIPPSWNAKCVVVRDKLYVFGGHDEWRKTLRSYSLAIFDPSNKTWSWQIKAHALPPKLKANIMVSSLYGGQKILVLGSSKDVQVSGDDNPRYSITKDQVFTFDPSTHIFAQDVHGHGDFPTSFEWHHVRLRPFKNTGSVVLFTLSMDKDHFSVWHYQSFPENRWNLLWKNRCLGDAKVEMRDIMCHGGKAYVIVQDKRGKAPRSLCRLNAYVDLERLIATRTGGEKQTL